MFPYPHPIALFCILVSSTMANESWECSLPILPVYFLIYIFHNGHLCFWKEGQMLRSNTGRPCLATVSFSNRSQLKWWLESTHIYDLCRSVMQRKAEIRSQAQLLFHLASTLLNNQVCCPNFSCQTRTDCNTSSKLRQIEHLHRCFRWFAFDARMTFNQLSGMEGFSTYQFCCGFFLMFQF